MVLPVLHEHLIALDSIHTDLSHPCSTLLKTAPDGWARYFVAAEGSVDADQDTGVGRLVESSASTAVSTA